MVLEVTGPDPALRRAKGKDDTVDAIGAAQAALTGQRVRVAKDRNGQVEALRVLRTTRKTAIKCKPAALQQLHNTIVAAPDSVREQLSNQTRMQLLLPGGVAPGPRRVSRPDDRHAHRCQVAGPSFSS